MRRIDEIIVHCSATKEGKAFHASDIDQWHKKKGWKCIGYHYVIDLDGKIEAGRPESEAGAHCLKHNIHSIGICYIGGISTNGQCNDTRTPAQKESMLKLLRNLKAKYPLAFIYGHRDFANKACPCFDATTEYKDLSYERSRI